MSRILSRSHRSFSCIYRQANNPFPLVDPNAQYQLQLQPQYTSLAPQFTAFNPYQQQAQQEAMQVRYVLMSLSRPIADHIRTHFQAQYMQQQQEWLRQQQEAQQAQLLAQQQQAQQEEWNRQQQQLLYQQQLAQQQQFTPQPQALAPQPTGFGSNNPFAPTPSFSQSPPPVPSLPSTSSGIDNFSLPSTYAHSPAPQTSSTSASSVSPAPPSAPSPASRPTRSDGEHAHLANLLANREDGLDTFGNIGNLRCVSACLCFSKDFANQI